MSSPAFRANIAANLLAAVVFAAAVWLWIRQRGGHCPLCNTRVA